MQENLTLSSYDVLGNPTLSAVLNYKHEQLVNRLQKRLNLATKEAQQLFTDTKLFLYLCGTNTGKSLAPSPAIDDGWHEFLMYTSDYSDFCNIFFGRFLHHQPRDQNDPNDCSKGMRAFVLAQNTFKEPLSENWKYPYLEDAGSLLLSDPCDSCGCSASCNDG